MTEQEISNAYTLIFETQDYLGPGDTALTRSLAKRLSLSLPEQARVTDLGCGVGASALILAEVFPRARVMAVDILESFIKRLKTRLKERRLDNRLTAVVGDMQHPPPLDGIKGEFDLIWSESAIYNIGRNRAFKIWYPLLKPGGWLVFSDIVWCSGSPQDTSEVTKFWLREYPDISTTEAIHQQLHQAGFQSVDTVIGGHEVWSNYYEPLRSRLDNLNQQTNPSPALLEVVEEIRREISIYDQAEDDVAVCFFVTQKP